jgi:hypothetical protein
MQLQCYEVTGDDVRAYHRREAEVYEKMAADLQAKLELIPTNLHDQCNKGKLTSLQQLIEWERALERGVTDLPGTHLVDRHVYLEVKFGTHIPIASGSGQTQSEGPF